MAPTRMDGELLERLRRLEAKVIAEHAEFVDHRLQVERALEETDLNGRLGRAAQLARDTYNQQVEQQAKMDGRLEQLQRALRELQPAALLEASCSSLSPSSSPSRGAAPRRRPSGPQETRSRSRPWRGGCATSSAPSWPRKRGLRGGSWRARRHRSARRGRPRARRCGASCGSCAGPRRRGCARWARSWRA
ncbi:unnamed protein product [Prorocentrum cordatum]|uniref:Uncharacterized protein n=1 Tax=Prorocentrum cordatum TaxID=2364126 RepID=A0ABN9XV75_9DINO|nr:unnamed protein product [Polarella glacialis]